MKPNASYRLSEKCPTGQHVGTVRARLTRTEIILDRPPWYVCGCQDPRHPRDRRTLTRTMGTDALRNDVHHYRGRSERP